MAPSINDPQLLARKNKLLVQSHMKQHQATWGPSLPASNIVDAPIQVFIRVRPLLQRDIEADAYSLVMDQPARTIHFTHPTMRWAGGRFATKTFDADGVFGERVQNDDVYEQMNVRSSLEACIKNGGHDFFFMAYGQTGTGKTYTSTSIEDRLASDIFALLPESNSPKVSISAFEIRGNGAYDLLSDPPHAAVKIQGVTAETTTYPGLSRHDAPIEPELRRLIETSKGLRFTRSTVKNDTSSRSHCIVNVHFIHSAGDTSDVFIVDLAGTERSNYAFKNDADRIKESIETNKSLAVLKDCIRARLTPLTKHVPWRGSKLTMVLHKAFKQSEPTTASIRNQRTCRLVILACISPSVIDAEDTLSTLKYITPFQLTGKDTIDDALGQTLSGSSQSQNANEWNHDESVAYIERYLSKLVPVVSRLLPIPTSTISSLFPLSLAELTTLACSPAPNESSNDSLVSPRALAQIRTWIDGYHRKLAELAKRSADHAAMGVNAAPGTARRAGATTEAALLNALNGRNAEANETGFVTRINLLGRAVHIEAGRGVDRLAPATCK